MCVLFSAGAFDFGAVSKKLWFNPVKGCFLKSGASEKEFLQKEAKKGMKREGGLKNRFGPVGKKFGFGFF